ncbi:CHAT domain-containing protein [Oxynema sp. CENA135]|uniref:CHAT domain-containing protein n=1 Tax=Oxynema sp. CENA135 TaxID=984206 RepID=UPI00190B251A|nr:CHAT domain-containing protein [Oxynema sp. CENA135]MBK4732630.1 CHAT domain-containing protein [Oxynema sp. CENA135]
MKPGFFWWRAIGSSAIALLLFYITPARPQTGNQSDITGPTPIEIPEPEELLAPEEEEPLLEDNPLLEGEDPFLEGEAPFLEEPPPLLEEGLQPPPEEGLQPPPEEGLQPPPGDGPQPPPGDGPQPPPGDGPQPPGDGPQPPPQEGQRPPGDGPQPPPQEGQRPPGDGPQPPPQESQRPPEEQRQPPPPRDERRPEPQLEPPPPAEQPPPPQQSENQPREAQKQEPVSHQPGGREVDRPAYEAQIQQADIGVAVQTVEEFQAVEFQDYLEVDLYGNVPSYEEISRTLGDLEQMTAQKTAFIYVAAQTEGLEILMVTAPSEGDSTAAIERYSMSGVSRDRAVETIADFRKELFNPKRRSTRNYLGYAQQLYQWIVAPLAADLAAKNIENLVFSMDSGLRTIPLAALHDGEQFLIEKYAVALVPSFGLTDVSYVDIRNTPVLAMGSEKFNGLPALPAVPLEVSSIFQIPWFGEGFINEQFTLDNFRLQAATRHFGVIHLATHAEFKPGKLENSYIQFFQKKLNLRQFRELAQELGWTSVENPPIELLVLSACRTAVGEEQAELGFAGLAVLSGVKSVLGSLWYVSDAATLGLMSEFYHHLRETPIKVQALRESQLALLRGKVEVKDGLLYLSTGETLALPPELAQFEGIDFSHPYYWSAFTLVGNWN